MDTNCVILLISSPFDFARWHLLSTFYFGPILGHLLANFDARLSDEKFTVLFKIPLIVSLNLNIYCADAEVRNKSLG